MIVGMALGEDTPVRGAVGMPQQVRAYLTAMLQAPRQYARRGNGVMMVCGDVAVQGGQIGVQRDTLSAPGLVPYSFTWRRTPEGWKVIGQQLGELP